jgi:hypothetical protein
MEAIHGMNRQSSTAGNTESNISESETESEIIDQDPEIDEDEKDQEDEDEQDDDYVWDRIMSEVLDSEGGPNSFKKEEGEKFDTKKLTKAIGNLVEDYIEFAGQIQDTDVYSEIDKEKQRLIENGYEEEEACKAAWNNRKYLVKKYMVEPFSKKVQEQETNDDDDDIDLD